MLAFRDRPQCPVTDARAHRLTATTPLDILICATVFRDSDRRGNLLIIGPLGASGVTVNGRITLDPHSDGTVGVGGSTTIYPSMETYQYRDGQPPVQLQWDPANSGGPWGPSTSLERHHWVGDTNIPAVRPNMPDWKWELENLNPFADDPLISRSTQLTDPFKGNIPTVAAGK